MKPQSNERAHCAPSGPAPERRRDPVTGLCHVLAAGRQSRPNEMGVSLPAVPEQLESCPFCRGREDETTPTLAWFHSDAGETEAQNWQVRVVENLYPAFVTLEQPSADSGSTDRSIPDDALPSLAPGGHSSGHHQVIIESPNHIHTLGELAASDIKLVFEAYRHQYRHFSQSETIRYALLFKNQGQRAGMSRTHVHSQLIALPDVPPLAQLELRGAKQFFERQNQCVFCHLAREAQQAGRVVLENESIVAYCPYASRVPYEVWLQPKHHEASFEETPDGPLADAAHTLHQLLVALRRIGLRDYNYVFHSAPFDISRKDHYHWHIEIIPRSSFMAGLELGAGLMINTMDPEDGAKELREHVSTNND